MDLLPTIHVQGKHKQWHYFLWPWIVPSAPREFLWFPNHNYVVCLSCLLCRCCSIGSQLSLRRNWYKYRCIVHWEELSSVFTYTTILDSPLQVSNFAKNFLHANSHLSICLGNSINIVGGRCKLSKQTLKWDFDAGSHFNKVAMRTD